MPASSLLKPLDRAVGRLIHLPDREEPVEVVNGPHAPPIPRGTPLRALVWNIQFCGSRRHHFFYDGGRAVHVPPMDVRHTLDEVARVLREHQPDLVLLQEVDRGSDRTGRVDQHAALLARAPFPCHTSTPYHRAAWVPHPPHQHLGRVDLHLSVFSRFRLSGATRLQLALLREPWWRRLFNLRRCLLDVRLPLDRGDELCVFNTHLSAFSHGDGTLERQVARVLGRVSAEPRWILGGDFNALPPGDDPRRLGPDAQEYPESTPPLLPLVGRFASTTTLDPARRTYLPFGAFQPDRQIDHVLFGPRVQPGEAQVLQERSTSDHLPLLVTFTIP